MSIFGPKEALLSALGLICGAAGAQEPGADADCAAFWEGNARFAEISAYLDGEAAARDAAAVFRSRAVAENSAAQVDAHIAREAPGRMLMIEAFTLGDETSRRLTLRALERCAVPGDRS